MTKLLELGLNDLRDECNILRRLIWEANGERGSLVQHGHTSGNDLKTVQRWFEETFREWESLRDRLGSILCDR